MAHVSRVLGHSSIQITVDVYSHVLKTATGPGVDLLNTIAPAGPACSLSAPCESKKAVTR